MRNTDFINGLQFTLEKQISILKTELLPLTAELLSRPRSDGGWSIAQCIQHLNTYADHYIPLIEKKLNDQPQSVQQEVVQGWLGSYFIKMMDPENTSKYKAAKKHRPGRASDGHREILKLTGHLQELDKLLKGHPGADCNKIRISTSIIGFVKLRLGDTLEFILMHNHRHLNQALNNLKEESNG